MSDADAIRDEIEREVADHKILVYGKGTKDLPRCGFTLETIQFFNHFGYPFEVIDVLENMPKRDVLSGMTDWPTLPKVFIGGKFYGDTDILGPMAENGELQQILRDAFPGTPEPSPVINLRYRWLADRLAFAGGGAARRADRRLCRRVTPSDARVPRLRATARYRGVR